MRSRGSIRVFVAGVIASGAIFAPRHAGADAFLSPLGTSMAERSISMLVVHDGTRETIIQELEVNSTTGEALWLIALPARPTSVRAVEPGLIATLDTLTKVREPHNETLRRQLFGPSVVTLLTKKLIDEPPRPKDETDTSNMRRLQLVDFSSFEGRVATSTITGRAILPLDIVALLERMGTIDLPTETAVASILNRDWALVIATIRDPRPASGEPAKLGAIIIEVPAVQPFLPVSLSNELESLPLHAYLASSVPLAPIALETFWDARPWSTVDPQRNIFYVAYNRPIGDDVRIDFELRERNNLGISPTMRLMRTDVLLPPGPRSDLTLIEAKESVTLPVSGGRDSARDLLMVMLLGLTPLLYTPESWFLLWLGARARERARREGRPLGVRLWSAFALAVGVYWFFTLEGGARVAAIIPAFIGIIQLALPYVERERAPIRVQFKKKKTAQK